MIDPLTAKVTVYLLLLVACFRWWRLGEALRKIRKEAGTSSTKKICDRLRDFEGFEKIYKN